MCKISWSACVSELSQYSAMFAGEMKHLSGAPL